LQNVQFVHIVFRVRRLRTRQAICHEKTVATRTIIN